MPSPESLAAPLTPLRRLRARLGLLLTALLLLLLWAVLGWAGSRWSLQLDLSTMRSYSLSAPSRAVLERLQGPVLVLAFVADPVTRRAARQFVERYRRLSPGVQLELVDPFADPERVRAYRVQSRGELVLEYQGRRETVRPSAVRGEPGYSEHAFSNALQRLVDPRRAVITFLAGHGERNPAGRANADLGDWADYLKQHGYRIAVLSTPGRTQPIPRAVELLVLSGPRVPLGASDLRLVEGYLEGGGNLLWLADPDDPAGSGLHALARQLGVGVSSQAMRQAHGSGQLSETMVLTTPDAYQAHPALAGFDLPVLFPGAGTLQEEPAAGDAGRSPGRAWRAAALITPVEDTGTGQDRQRYRHTVLAVALERAVGAAVPEVGAPGGATDPQAEPGTATGARPQRAVLVGDGDFLSNTYLGNGGNAELGLRLVNWLLRDLDRVVIPVPRPADARLDLQSDTLVRLRTLFGVILPSLLLLTGLWLGVRRRRL